MTNVGAGPIGLKGGCQCGAVRYRLDATPGGNICHCRMCQKAGGGPFMAFGGVPRGDFRRYAGRASDFSKFRHRRARVLRRLRHAPDVSRAWRPARWSDPRQPRRSKRSRTPGAIRAESQVSWLAAVLAAPPRAHYPIGSEAQGRRLRRQSSASRLRTLSDWRRTSPQGRHRPIAERPLARPTLLGSDTRRPTYPTIR